MLKSAIAIGFVTVFVTAPCSAQTRPLTATEQRVISSTYGAQLKDPSSAQFQWAPLPLADSLKGGQLGYCFRVNAKNSFGAYTGFKLILGTLRRVNGQIVAFSYVAGQDDTTPALAQTTADLCRTFGIRF